MHKLYKVAKILGLRRFITVLLNWDYTVQYSDQFSSHPQSLSTNNYVTTIETSSIWNKNI